MSRRNEQEHNDYNTLLRVLSVFTRLAITPPRVNRFGWNLEQYEYIVGSWLWQILSAIRIAVTTAGEPGDHHKLTTSFTQTDFVTTRFKATRPQKLSPLLRTGLMNVNRHYCVLWIHCNSTRSLVSALVELFFIIINNKNSSGDEIANVLVNDDIAHT